MWGSIKKSLSPSMLVSLFALTVALGGTSYAAVAIANNSVGSPQIKPGGVQTSDLGDSAVTSQKIKNGTIAATDLKPQVSQAQRALRSGETMRGTFLAAGANTPNGYIGTSITFPHRLPANFVKSNVQYIDGATSTQCPGVGQAAPGWACFYEGQNSLATLCCIYSENYNDPSVGTFGTRIYWTVTGSNYVDGNWAITAP